MKYARQAEHSAIHLFVERNNNSEDILPCKRYIIPMFIILCFYRNLSFYMNVIIERVENLLLENLDLM